MNDILFESFRAVMMNNPSAARADQMAEFVDLVKSNPVMIEQLATSYFDSRFSYWCVKKVNEGGFTFARVDTSTANKRRKKERVSELKKSLRDILLLDLTLPDGKKLRYATGAECHKAGGFFREVAMHIKPTEVVDRHLSETDLKNIRSRFYEKRKTASPLSATA